MAHSVFMLVLGACALTSLERATLLSHLTSEGLKVGTGKRTGPGVVPDAVDVRKMEMTEQMKEETVMEDMGVAMPMSTTTDATTTVAPPPISRSATPGMIHAISGDSVQSFQEAATKLEAMEVAQAPGGTAGVQETHAIPVYLYSGFISIKFVEDKDSVVIAFGDMLELPGLPHDILYIYPIVLLVLSWLIWAYSCAYHSRAGLSWKLVVEATGCFACLWAELATKHQVLTKTRAWGWVALLMCAMSGWNIAAMAVHHAKGNETLVFYVCFGLCSLLWIAFAFERTITRKAFRRIIDHYSSDHYVSDCFASTFCPQYSALQETQYLAETELPNTVGTKSMAKAQLLNADMDKEDW